MAGAPKGNSNPADGKLWKAAIRKALDKRNKTKSRKEGFDSLVDLAEKFLEACDDKEGWAFKELGDRIDGKAVQPIAGADGGPVVIEIVKFGADQTPE